MRVAGIGPVSIVIGSTPSVTSSTILARGVRPSSSAVSVFASSSAAAPSEICEELPPVSVPPSLKAGFSSAELLRRRPRPDALVDRVHLAVDLEVHRLAPERARLARRRRPLLRARRELVPRLPRDLPALGDQLGRQPLRQQLVAVEQLLVEAAPELLLLAPR